MEELLNVMMLVFMIISILFMIIILRIIYWLHTVFLRSKRYISGFLRFKRRDVLEVTITKRFKKNS